MNSHHKIFSLLLILLCVGCDDKEPEIEEQLFDLFPLKVGNEFFYEYRYYASFGPGYIYVSKIGDESWKVISESNAGDTLKYTIKRSLSGVLHGVGPGSRNDTIKIENQISFLEIDCINLNLTFSDLTGLMKIPVEFKRYQPVSQIELRKLFDTRTPSWSLLFKADSGLTKFAYHDPPNQMYDEYLHLDSISLK